MPRWQFWKKDAPGPFRPAKTTPPPVASRARGFVPPPPREASLPDEAASSSDPVLQRLARRHDAIARELASAELATERENPWFERIGIIDEALDAIDRDLSDLDQVRAKPAPPVPALPVVIAFVFPDAPSEVLIRIGDSTLRYVEEIDWAERGTSVVRGELSLQNGEVQSLAEPLGLPERDRPSLESSLLAFVTDLRDRALAGESLPSEVSMSDLLKPCPECGGYEMWNGICLACEQRRAESRRLADERNRLFDERREVLEDREKTIENLPSLRRRQAEAKAALEKALTGASES
jgi:hypothetical protein